MEGGGATTAVACLSDSDPIGGVRAVLLENKSRSERMRKGGAITANTLTYFTPRAVVLRGGGTDSYVMWNRPVWLRSSRTAPTAAAGGDASAGGGPRGCRGGQDGPAPQQAAVPVTNYITRDGGATKPPSALIKGVMDGRLVFQRCHK